MVNGRFCPKTDVWAAGVILYLMLAGQFPFEADQNADIFQNICPEICIHIIFLLPNLLL